MMVTEADQIKSRLIVTDQMISQHAWMRDHYASYSQALDILLLLVSATLAALTFADLPKILGTNFDPQPIVGALSIAIFVLSVIGWKVDWKGRENAHAQSVDLLTQVKRGLSIADSGGDGGVLEAIQNYNIVIDRCAKIPEKYFLKTKRHHKRKVAISKELDVAPATFIWVIKLKLWWQHTVK